MNYEQLKKDAHALYLGGHIPQRMALSIMGYGPSKNWLVTKLHTFVAWCVKKILEEVKREVS